MSRTYRSTGYRLDSTWGSARKGKHYKRAAVKAERQYIRAELAGFNPTDRRVSRTASETNWKGM